MNFPVTLPEKFIQKAIKLGIKPEDISETFIRGSGKGGQKINKTSSTVRLIHLPTKIEIRCQEYREQISNRITAYKLLILKIEEKILGKQSEKAKKIYKIRKQKARRTRRSKEKMLVQKHQRSELKETRKSVSLRQF